MERLEELMPKNQGWHNWASIEQLRDSLNKAIPSHLGFKSFIMADGVINIEQEFDERAERYKLVKHPIKAGWFALAEAMSISSPVIVNWEPEWLNDDDALTRLEKMRPMMLGLDRIGLRVHTMRIAGSSVQMYTSRDEEGVDIIKSLGLKVEPEMHPGKLLKRLSVLSPSEGACYNSGMFATKTGRRIYLHVEQDRPQADGALWMSYAFARELCADCGIEWDENITRLQVWILSHVGMVKGMASIGGPQGVQTYDLIAPKESVDQNLTIQNGTLIKAVAHRLDEYPPTFQAFDGLLRMPELAKHVSMEEVIERQNEWLLNQDLLEHSLMTSLDNVNIEDLEDEELDGKEKRRIERIVSMAEARVFQDAAKRIMRSAGYSAFAMPEIMEQMTGRTLRSYNAKRSRWLHDDSGLVMPGAYVSCLRGYWSDPLFSGVEEPPVGELGFIWKFGVIDGFVMNGEEMLSKDVRYRSDGGDLDDLLDVVLVYTRWDKGEELTPMAWVVRNPTSWGGGWFMRVRQEDWDRCMSKGYKAYTLNEDYEICDLAEIMMGPNPPGLRVRKYEQGASE